MRRRKPTEHIRRTLRGLIVVINRGIRYAQRDKQTESVVSLRAGVVGLVESDSVIAVDAVKSTEKTADVVPAQTPTKPPRKPFKPLPPALQGKTQDIAERSDGTYSGFMSELEKEGYVVFDYETTGLGADGNVPVQIGAVRVKDGEIVERLNLFVNPQRPLGSWAKDNLKGPDGEPLTDEWLSDQTDLKTAHEQLAAFIGDQVLVAHNYPFDGEVLERSMREAGIDFAPAGTLDTFSLVKQLVPRSYGKDPDLPQNHQLKTLAEFYGVPLGDGAHTADADCEAAAHILRKIIEHGERRGVEPHMLNRETQQERYDKMMYYYEKNLAEYQEYQRQKKEPKAMAGVVYPALPDEAPF